VQHRGRRPRLEWIKQPPSSPIEEERSSRQYRRRVGVGCARSPIGQAARGGSRTEPRFAAFPLDIVAQPTGNGHRNNQAASCTRARPNTFSESEDEMTIAQSVAGACVIGPDPTRGRANLALDMTRRGGQARFPIAAFFGFLATGCTEPVGSERKVDGSGHGDGGPGGTAGAAAGGSGGGGGGQPGSGSDGSAADSGGADAQAGVMGGTGGNLGMGRDAGGTDTVTAVPPDGPSLGCVSMTKRCGSDNTRETCTNAGTWTPEMKCQYVCTGNGECTGSCVPGRTQCAGTVRQMCDGNGRWVDSSGDCTAPRIESISPRDGEVGVRSDAFIEIVFDEEMDHRSTEMAFSSADIGPMTFEWRPGDRIVRVRREGGFEYATGTSLSTVAKTYRYTMATTATDRAGNRLERSAAASFSTLRRITTTVRSDGTFSGHAGGGTVIADDGYTFTRCDDGDRGFITFKLSALPSGVVGIVASRMNLTMTAPFQSSAPVDVTRIRFSRLEPSIFHIVGDPVGTLATDGAMSTLTDERFRQAVWEDYVNRGTFSGLSQYRFQARCRPGDPADGVSYDPYSATITADILVP
jgi:hypothetical protein